MQHNSDSVKIFILLLITALLAARALWILYNKRDANFLIISFFIIATAFQYNVAIVHGGTSYIGGGTLSPDIRLTVTIIMDVILIHFMKFKKENFKKLRWVGIVLLFCLISFVNPFDKSPVATAAFVVFFLSHILLFEMFFSFMSRSEIIKGIFDGFLMLSLIQFPLAICFPALGIKSVTIPFQDAAELDATRYGQRDGAVGIFPHPGYLALYSIISSCFFLACYFKGYRKKQCLLLLTFNTTTLILTYSRTAYLVYVFDLAAVLFFYKNAKRNIISLSNFFKFILPVALLLIWVIYYSPLSENFLESNVDDMTEARLIFLAVAVEIFKTSPVVGVGLNAHRDYIINHSNILTVLTSDTFYLNNPIHNINLIVLVETGLLGFICWLVFLITSFIKSKQDLSKNRNEILSMSYIGVLIAVFLYGMTGWAPFSITMLPFFLFFTFFSIRYRSMA